MDDSMKPRSTLLIFFTLVLISMLCVTTWATMVQPLTQWGGLTRAPDNAWTIATLADAYFGFLTFFAWVCWKQVSMTSRVGWFVAIMLLGNMAMAAYMLLELRRLRDDESLDVLLTRRNP
jgi:hypothetical protein